MHITISLLDLALKFPDRISIVEEDAKISYAALTERCLKYVNVIRDLGLSEGDRLAIVARRSASTIVALLGARLANLTVCLIDAEYPSLSTRNIQGKKSRK